jgi:hypothetical protein
MAFIRLEPVDVRVKTGWIDGTPREIQWGNACLPVRRLTAVRDETSAFKAPEGPRTVFEVETPGARLALSFRHRTRRWAIEGVDDEVDLEPGPIQ